MFMILPDANTISFFLLSVGLLCALYRLLKGPSLPDRVISLDVLGTLMVGMIALYAARMHQSVFLHVAMVLALISFLGTVAFSRYLEKRGFDERKSR